MSITESAKSIREQGRLHRHSSLIQGNVIAFVFRSLDPDSVSSSVRSSNISKSETLKEDNEDKHDSCVPSKLFQLFIDANKDSMNRRLVESFDELRVIGWIAPYTLLLTGPSEDTEILKNSWSQRLLRNPKGFLLKDVGSVKDFVVESVPHSQFVSLATALFDSVVELDRNGRCASRDTIIKYLKNVYHNVRIPSEEIVHKCLGKLIEQRKIYHDGVGYRALIDDSPVHKNKEPEPIMEHGDESVVKMSVKSSVKGKSDCESAYQSSGAGKDHKQKSRRKLYLSDGSKEESASKAHSDEDRHRFNLQFLDHVFNNSTPLMPKKGGKEKENSKKKKPLLLACAGKSAVLRLEDNMEEEIKIIDIAEHMSVLKQGNRHSQNDVKDLVGSAKNVDPSHDPGQPYDKHSRNPQSKRPKPHRSRSFTEPSKHRLKHRSSKTMEKQADFPLRRVMGTEELRTASKRDRHVKSEKNGKNKDNGGDTRICVSKDSKISSVTPKEHHDSGKGLEKTQIETIVEKCDIFFRDVEISSKSSKDSRVKNDSDTPSVINISDTPSVSNTSDTYSVANTSDASSPLQIKKRKDVSENYHNHMNNNNTHEHGLTCICLTGKIKEPFVVDEGCVNKQSEKNGVDVRIIEDDSIFDYVDSEQDPSDDDLGICTDNSLEVGYGF